MEYPMKNEGGKEIKFTMLLQAGGRMLFRAQSSLNRYLVRNRDGLLEITGNPTDEMEWRIHYVKPSMGIPRWIRMRITQGCCSKSVNGYSIQFKSLAAHEHKYISVTFRLTEVRLLQTSILQL
ncbi:uncharacterized protein LOC144429943 [Styela clava]